MQRTLHVIDGGPANGIEIVHLSKHGPIDPSGIPAARLSVITNHTNGSKWLHTISEREQVDIILAVLKYHGVSLMTPRSRYKSDPLPDPVGISNGQYVHSVEVWKDWGRWVHGYPCDP